MTQGHDKLAGIRQMMFDGAMMSHETRRLGITEAELREAIWSAKTEIDIAMNLQRLREKAGAAAKPTYHEVPADAVQPTTPNTATAGSQSAER